MLNKSALLIVMGVSGSGKSSLGPMLATELGVPFVEGDDLHPAANIEKMRRGEPLTDEDREPWLEQICARLTAAAKTRESLVLACSALKRDYRRRFLAAAPGLMFVYLKAHRQTILERLTQRKGHFMTARLLDSQFAALQEPDGDEPVIMLNAALSPEDECDAVIARLSCIR